MSLHSRFILSAAKAAVALLVVAGTPAVAQAPRTPAEQARADGGKMPFTTADAEFMAGMIGHHAQAVVMSEWAVSHGASGDVRGLAARIAVAQRDEIGFMQRWLRERNLAVPDTMVMMPGMSGHNMAMMPGMLTPEQMNELDRARGADFDRLFLGFMIKHHEGALTMVKTLFSSPGAGQELYVFRFASDVDADQNTEIDRMQLMLDSRPAKP